MCSGALARTSNEPVMGIFRRDWGIEPNAPPERAAAPSRIYEFTHPACRLRSTFSTTTIASSTTIPTASTSPNSDRLFAYSL